MKKITSILIAVCMLFSLTACGDKTCTDMRFLTPEEFTLVSEGDFCLLGVEVTPKDTTDPVHYYSSDENVATVNEDGLVTAVGPGTATITAVCGDVVRFCECICDFGEVTVSEVTEQEKPTDLTPPQTEETTEPASQEQAPAEEEPVAEAPAVSFPSTVAEEISVAKRTIIYTGGSINVAFWGADEYLCSCLTDQMGMPDEPLIEAQFPDRVTSVGIRGEDMYLSTDEALYRLDLAEFQNGSAQAEMLSDDLFVHGFAITDDYIYYLYLGDIKKMPIDGGDGEVFLEDPVDYEYTDSGIWHTHASGGLYHMSYDGVTEYIADTPEDSLFVLSGDVVYYWNAQGTQLFQRDLKTNVEEEIILDYVMDPAEHIWVYGDFFIYTDSDGDCHRHFLSDHSEEDAEGIYALPSKHEGAFIAGFLYCAYTETLYARDLFSGFHEEVRLGDLEDGAYQSPNTSASGSFDIGSGMQIIYGDDTKILSTDYIAIVLPKDPDWEVEQVNNTTLVFYLPEARDAGFGGEFVSVKAYEQGDDSYLDLPSYRVITESAERKYIAIYPTDVCYDFTDKNQTNNYKALMEVAEKLGTVS